MKYNTQQVFWVGSVWNNELNQGNIEEIDELKRVLAFRGIRFIHKHEVSDQKNIAFVRKSRIAPAFGGLWQEKVNLLPIRVFKNISYGQLGITNILKFKEILDDTFINGGSIEELIEYSLSIPKNDYLDLISAQQEKIKDHTYLDKIASILVALER